MLDIIYTQGGENKVIGKVLNTNEELQEEIESLGLPQNDPPTVDVIITNIIMKDSKNYYIRFGTLLKYMENHIFPKIISNSENGEDLAYLKIDTTPHNNIMYTIPNQLSTNPNVCLIKNNIKYKKTTNTFFKGIEEYVGETAGIKYGKVMNIYLSFDYLLALIESGGMVSSISVFKFLNNICDDINDSLGGVNNLEPVIDESINTIVIIEQTKIPGKNKLLKELNIKTPTITKPILEVFGYDGTKSNFVKNIGLTTAITKEYATMITIGATAAGYVPGVEATAFSRWNEGIKDRFKTGLKDPDSPTKDPKKDFIKDNEAIIKKYLDYINQPIEQMIGFNYKSENIDTTNITNENLISNNTSTVSNFNRYLQASASIAHPKPESVETSVGFLPFNLSVTMDGIGGIKIYNKLEVKTEFLPSNYEESMEFVVTGVNHKLSNNNWETSLDTIGISRGNSDPSVITIPVSAYSPESTTFDLEPYFDTTPSSFKISTKSFGYSMGTREKSRVKQIYLHHTAGHQYPANLGKRTVDVFNSRTSEGNSATTHAVIDANGHIEEVVPWNYVAYGQGVKRSKIAYNKIGMSIEIEALGYFNEKRDGKWWRGSISIPESEAASGVDWKGREIKYKGYQVYQKYTQAQIDGTVKWIKKWMEFFDIEWVFDEPAYKEMFPKRGLSKAATNGLPGVYSHGSVNALKNDIFPQKELIVALRNEFKTNFVGNKKQKEELKSRYSYGRGPKY